MLKVLSPPRPPLPKGDRFAWQPLAIHSTPKDSLYLSSPKPYIPLSTPIQQSPSRPQPVSISLAARSSPKGAAHPGSLLPGSTFPSASSQPRHHSVAARTVYSGNASSNPRHEAVGGNKKVSSLYVPCLSNNICRVAAQSSSCVAPDPATGTPLEAAGARAQAPSLVSHAAGTGKPPSAPPGPPKLFFDIHKDAAVRGESPSLCTRPLFPDVVRPPVLGPQLSSAPENRKRKEPYLLQPCYPAKARN